MAKQPFIADPTIPGLGASDLARLMGTTCGTGFGGKTRPKARRSLKSLLRKLAGLRASAS